MLILFDAQLNRIDAVQQQRQQQYQQDQADRLQPQSDVRLDTTSQEKLALSNHEYPCYLQHR